MKIKYICKICNIEFYSSLHLKTHNITAKQYYDKYIKKDSEGLCKLCGKPTTFLKFSVGYLNYCSNKCARTVQFQSNEFKTKRTETCIKKYGVAQPFSSSEIQEKIRKTKLEKYGYVCGPMFTDTANSKRINTFINKYGVSNPNQSQYIKEKKKQTCLEKYGVEYYSQTDEFKSRVKQTCLEKYGVEYISQNKEIRQKQKETCLEKYGVEYPAQSLAVKKHNLQSNKIIDIDGTIFDSLWEYNYKNYLVKNGIKYEYHTIRLEWFDINNKIHYYFPDFKIWIDDKIQLIEIKGDYFFDDNKILINPYDSSEEAQINARLKYDCMIKNNIQILTSNELLNLGIELRKKI